MNSFAVGNEVQISDSRSFWNGARGVVAEQTSGSKGIVYRVVITARPDRELYFAPEQIVTVDTTGKNGELAQAREIVNTLVSDVCGMITINGYPFTLDELVTELKRVEEILNSVLDA